jgi:hypothetical protein
MTAAAADRKAPQYGTPDTTLPLLGTLPMAASTTIYFGTLVASDASGNAVPASSSTAQKVWGRCEKQVVNSGIAGAATITFKPGVFAFNNSTGVDLIAASNVGAYCYVVDDNTVALTDGGGARQIAGQIFPFDPNNLTQVQVGVGPGFASAYVANPNVNAGGSTVFKARGVVYANVSALATFTVASNDGITYVAGDIVLLTAQTTAKQNGPYVVGTVASTTAPLTRPDWWVTGAPISPGQVINVGGEGTIFGGSEWKTMCAKAKVVDTDDPTFYPRVCKGTVTIASGIHALGSAEGLFLFSTTTSPIMLTRNKFNSGSTTTVGYQVAVADRTAGVSGTAAATIRGFAAAGTNPTDDASTVDFLVTNW